MKFLDWLYSKRKPVSYTLGVLNMLLGAVYFYQGNAALGTIWLVLGIMFTFDAYDSK